MGQIIYDVTISTINKDLYGGATIKGSVSRQGDGLPSGSVLTGGELNITNVNVYTSREPYLSFPWFETSGMPQSSGFVKLSLENISSSIIELTSDTFEATVSGSSTLKMCNFRSTSATIVLYYEDPLSKSTVSLDKSTYYFGEKINVSLSNPKIASVKHTLAWGFGNSFIDVDVAIGVSQYAYSIPDTWKSQIQGASTGTGSLTVVTKDTANNIIGQTQVFFNVAIGDDSGGGGSGSGSGGTPTVESMSYYQIVPSGFPISLSGIHIQDITGVVLTINGASGVNGSTITSYTFIVNGRYYTQSSNTYRVTNLQNSGTVNFSGYVTDSRGNRSATISVSISVIPYSKPTFNDSTSAYRCTQSGVASEDGTYLGAKVSYTASSIMSGGSNVNSVTAKCEYRIVGNASWTSGASSMVNNRSTPYIFGGSIQSLNQYEVRFTVQDTFNTVTKIMSIGTTEFTLFFKRGGNGVGVGKACTKTDSSMEINEDWKVYLGNIGVTGKNGYIAYTPSGSSSLQRVYDYGSIVFSTSQPSGYEGRIWLEPVPDESVGG